MSRISFIGDWFESNVVLNTTITLLVIEMKFKNLFFKIEPDFAIYEKFDKIFFKILKILAKFVWFMFVGVV